MRTLVIVPIVVVLLLLLPFFGAAVFGAVCLGAHCLDLGGSGAAFAQAVPVAAVDAEEVGDDTDEREGGEVSPAFRATPYPLPRFVSLGSDEVNVRTGPGEKYPIKWVFAKKGVPVEVVLEYESWRKIKDIDGQMGWVHGSLLSGRRGGIVQGVSVAPLHSRPRNDAPQRVGLEEGAVVALSKCIDDWCYAEVSGYKGWLRRKFIFGVYDKENFD